MILNFTLYPFFARFSFFFCCHGYLDLLLFPA